MAKRFTDTNKYKKPFIRGLQGAYKLLWDYLYHDCDHAGIWIVDFEIAQVYLGDDMIVNKADALKYFNSGEKRIVEIDRGKKWFIPSFIEFQYGELNEQNRAHNSVIKILKKYKIDIKTLISPLQGAKDMDKDKDKDMDKEKIIMFADFIGLFNSITKRNYKGCTKAKSQFNARIKDGYTIKDFEKAITNGYNDQHHKDTKYCHFTPEFITRSDKLEKFLNREDKKKYEGSIL